ncbi:MAG: ATP synthase F1 subunit epsilon [Acidobacteriota bacterium]
MAEALPEKLKLEIVTPDRLLFSGEVDEVTVPGADGYLGILPGHAPLLSELRIGVISFRQGEQHFRFFCTWGFLEVLPDQVSVLTEGAQAPDQIDSQQARADKEQAEETLRSRDPKTDFAAAADLLQSAQTRLGLLEDKRPNPV